MGFRALYALLAALALAACAPPASPFAPASLQAANPSPSPGATDTPIRTPTPAPTLPVFPSPIPSLEPGWQVCSPLALHPLEELPKIVSDPYAPPPPGREERHHGVDFGYYHYAGRDSMLGEPVQSMLPGVVASWLDDRFPYGNMVMVETALADLPAELPGLLEAKPGEALYALYAHLDRPPLARLGEAVIACQPLGEVGLSGNSDVPHLHVETRLGPAGTVFESMRFYDTRATLEEMEAYQLWRTSGVFRHFDPMLLLTSSVQP